MKKEKIVIMYGWSHNKIHKSWYLLPSIRILVDVRVHIDVNFLAFYWCIYFPMSAKKRYLVENDPLYRYFKK